MKQRSGNRRRRVEFRLSAEPRREVYVAGSFNAWDPRKTPLKYKNGAYTTSVLLPEGRYEYKFVVDDTWCADPESHDWVANPFGSLNSVLTV